MPPGLSRFDRGIPTLSAAPLEKWYLSAVLPARSPREARYGAEKLLLIASSRLCGLSPLNPLGFSAR